LTPSLQVAGWQTFGPLASVDKAPPLVFPPCTMPPPTTEASAEASRPASGVGAVLEQTPVAQSLPSPHSLPTAQGLHGPPQSTSTSPSFFTPSAQVGG